MLQPLHNGRAQSTLQTPQARDGRLPRSYLPRPSRIAANAAASAIVRGSDSPSRRCESSQAFSPDRKSTRLNSSHLVISYAVFCLKKKKKKKNISKHINISKTITTNTTAI